jgi:hypothetical protein
MENLPNDAISLPSRVFYSPSEDKLYFGEVGDYKEVPRPQSFDDVLGIDNKTDKEAGFIDNNKNTVVKPEGMVVADDVTGSFIRLISDGIELKKESGAGEAKIVSYEEAGDTEHTLQAKSGTIAHLSDVLTLVYNQNKKNTQTATNTTVAVRMNEVTTGSLVLTPDMMTIGKTLYFEAYGETDLTAPDKMSFFISLGGEDVEIPIDIGGSAYVAHSYNIKGYIDFTDGANEEREFNFSGELRINVDMSSSGVFLPFTYQIPTTTLEIDATNAKGFIIDVQHETTNTTTTCYKSLLKQLN